MVSFSKWGLLETAGLNEGILLSILANGGNEASEECQYPQVTTVPTCGILIELYHFASTIACTLRRRPNRVLKLLVETLFPLCKVSRADRLERRIKQFCNQLDSIENEEQDDYLQMEWTPQATGIVHVHTVLCWSVV